MSQEGDAYISTVPVDIMKLMLPDRWSKMPFFKQMDGLEGVPVINIHIWCAAALAERIEETNGSTSERAERVALI